MTENFSLAFSCFWVGCLKWRWKLVNNSPKSPMLQSEKTYFKPSLIIVENISVIILSIVKCFMRSMNILNERIQCVQLTSYLNIVVCWYWFECIEFPDQDHVIMYLQICGMMHLHLMYYHPWTIYIFFIFILIFIPILRFWWWVKSPDDTICKLKRYCTNWYLYDLLITPIYIYIYIY